MLEVFQSDVSFIKDIIIENNTPSNIAMILGTSSTKGFYLEFADKFSSQKYKYWKYNPLPQHSEVTF